MNLDTLLAGLDHPQANVRLSTARVIGMVDETRALGALGRRYKAETDPHVRGAIAWAGQRLHAAQQAGYSTLDEIFEYFHINAEIRHGIDPAEAEVLRQMEADFEARMIDMQDGAGLRRAGTVLAAGLLGGAVGGMAMGLTMMGNAMSTGAVAPSSNLAVGGLEGQVTRTPPTMPCDADIGVWVRRLSEAPVPDDRRKAAIELGQLHNPAALPYLAQAFLADPSPDVREAAGRFGKIIYWNALYWAMEQDGSLAGEIARRREALNLGEAPQPTTKPPAPADQSPGPEEDIGAILRQAQAARARRQQRRR